MKKRYIIDVLNLLNDWDLGRELLRKDGLEIAVQRLIDHVAFLHDAEGCEVHLVVDGKGSQMEQLFPFPNTQSFSVVYAPAHLTADGVIERWASALPDAESIVLVSNDRAIQHSILAREGDFLRPNDFVQLIEQQQKRHSRQMDLKRKSEQKDWNTPFNGLSF